MSNEITVKLKCSIKEICNLLESKNFRTIRKFSLEDSYFIHHTLPLDTMSSRELLSKAILIRNITEFMPKNEHIIKLTFKNKKIASNGIILNQNKTDCRILNSTDGEAFLNAIGYTKIMIIEENDIVLKNGDLKLSIKDIKKGDKLLEMETVTGNTELNTTEKLILILEKLNLPILTNDFFVKKAEIELDKILNKS